MSDPSDLPTQDPPEEPIQAPVGEDRTVFAPSPSTPPPPAAESVAAAVTQPPSAPAEASATVFMPAPAPAPGRVSVGAVLNHIYEVRRFLARGGMGEVYEGVNVNTDERVAIKVMLPHLAADPNVQAMFRKEARTLTRLAHPAVVQYRVLAQEPQLGVFYIVTEFIDGEPLGDVVGRYRPTAEQLEQLTRRLVSGLNAAHELGAIHRDMSPDNVLLPQGRLDEAKVIDFGIAKDLDPSNATIVGDGFAGKLGYVAPEQFGDYDRSIGPWTDVYSLALVILAFANGKPVDMGATLVEAIDRRRQGPDLTILPERLRPVFAGMLAPDPQARFRSMGEVLKALDGAPATAEAPARPASPAPSAKPARSGPPTKLLVAGGVGAVLVIAGATAAIVLSSKPAAVSSGSGAAAPAASPGSFGPSAVEQVRRSVEASINTTPCSWLDIDRVSSAGGGVALGLSGVAGDPGAANAAVSKAAQAGGAQASTDTSAVSAAAPAACPALDAFRTFRVASSERGQSLRAAQSEPFTLQPRPENCPANNAKALIDLRIGDPSSSFALLGMEPSGRIQKLFASRAEFDAFRRQAPQFVEDLGGDAYRMTICTDQVGAAGLLLIKGAGPFATGASDKPALPAAGWREAFEAAGKAGGWKTEMVWYKVTG